MYRSIYLVVTPDKYELPLFVGTSKEVCEWAGITLNTLQWRVRRYNKGIFDGKSSGRRFVSVKDE